MNLPEASPRLRPIPLSDVRLLGGPFKRQQDVNARHLKAVDVERLLVPFFRETGIPTDAEQYGGWESRSINGHSLGHYLSAISLIHASTGAGWAKDRAEHVVDSLAACQRAMGDGALLPVPRKAYDDLRAGVINASPFELNGVWVPNYTLHKVFAGLRDAYRHANNEQALQVETTLADWLIGTLDNLNAEQVQQMLATEHGGMLEVFADLAADTGEDRYLVAAERFWFHRDVLDPLLDGIDALDGKHGNTQIPKVIGMARMYELTGNERYRAGAEFFWHTVVEKRSFANGGHGEAEHFFPVEQFPQRLTPLTAETCNTYNLLKLTGHLFAWEPTADKMDFAERALINHLLANIGREPGEFGYFLGLGSVGVKVFSQPCEAWWCCVGTGMENPTRYAEHAYFADDEALWVNLCLNSEAKWAAKGVVLRQETAFPDDDAVLLTIRCDHAADFTLRLRHPHWCKRPTLRINGSIVPVDTHPCSYINLTRNWHDGDVVEMRLPMTLRAEPLPNSGDSTIALLHGPNLLAATYPPEAGVPDPAKERFAEHLDARGKTDQAPPVLVAESVDQVLSRIEQGNAFGEFRTSDLLQSTDAALVPLHRVYEEHYAVYFPLMTPSEWNARREELALERERQRAEEAATVDEVTPGYQQPEVEHDLRLDKSAVRDFQGRKGRVAQEEGFFGYQLKVDGDAPNVLVVTYWGSEWFSPAFDILVDGQIVGSQLLRTNRPGDFFQQHYPIPESLTANKRHVRVEFRPHSGSTAGPVYGLRMMRDPARST